jgi:S1-C subfamily serine protease
MKRSHPHAALLFVAMLAGPMGLAQADNASDIPKTPDLGPASSAPLPPMGNVSGIGKAPGRTSPSKIRKVIETARTDQANVLRGPAGPDPLRRLGRSVVLVVTPTKLGSATLIDRNGTFVTSWHIVRDEKTVGIIYMPQGTDQRPTEADAVQANVGRTNPQTDLALINVANPARDIKPVPLAAPVIQRAGSSLQVLGHPYGDVWSYTQATLTGVSKGLAWTSEDGSKHQADVVQFRTHAITGNSGGPVLDHKDRLVAIDTMRSDDKSMLALAVAASEVRRLMTAPVPREAVHAFMAPAPTAAMKTSCEPVHLDTRRTRSEDGTVHVLDLNCNGHADAMLLVPDNTRLADHLASDANENGITDSVYFDFNRDGRFDEVRFDTDEDGKADLVGTDLDADLVPRSVRMIAR